MAHLKSFGLAYKGIQNKSIEEITNEVNYKCTVNCIFCTRRKSVECGDCRVRTNMSEQERIYYQNRHDDELLMCMSGEQQHNEEEEEEF